MLQRAMPLLAAAALAASAAGAADLVVVDDAGQTLRLARPAQRVVSLAPDLAEIMFAAGAGERLVGVAEHSDFPQAAQRLPRVGDAHGLDFERILALRPDLVLGWAGGNAPQHLARLRALGLTVYLSDIREPAGIASTIERLGELTAAPLAQSRGRELRARLRELELRYRGKATLSVFYQVWGQPLYTLGGSHLLSSALRLCGARNVFADLQALAAVIEIETVLRRDPDVIVAAAEGRQRPAWLEFWRRWPQLRAARQDALLLVDADLLNRHSPRFIEGLAGLCAALEQERGKALK